MDKTAKILSVCLSMVALGAAGCATSQGAASDDAPAPRVASAPPAADEEFAAPAELPRGPEAILDYEGERGDEAVAPGAKPSISRAALQRFLGQGPQYALQLIRVQPAFESGRFEGFQVVGFSEEGRRLARGVLEPGDVVVRINRRPISRPEDYMAAWESLKECVEVSLQIIRGGESLELVFPVEG